MKIHIYALCFNEAKLLPFFFRHYENIVDNFYIFDNKSTDGSIEILSNHPKVTLKSVQIYGPSFVLGALSFYNQCWKASKDSADWVIVCNIDEHLYHQNLRSYLKECQKNNYTLIIPEGYQMVSERFPSSEITLCEKVRKGVRDKMFDKPQIFKPSAIQEINYTPGRHSAQPMGYVMSPSKPLVKLLHYKFLGEDYYRDRLSELSKGLREDDIKRKFGHQYLWNEDQKANHFRNLLKSSKEVI